MFLDHLEDMARGHFTVRRLKENTGSKLLVTRAQAVVICCLWGGGSQFAHDEEPLTQKLTHFSGKDRQQLSQIVQRWGSLSDDLKRAVLRVVGYK